MKSPAMNTHIIFALSAALMLHVVVKGQSINPNTSRRIGLAPDFMAENVSDISITLRGSKWLTLRPEGVIEPRNIFAEYRDAFRLGLNDRIDLMGASGDRLGFVHYEFQQYFKGVLVEGAKMLVHARDADAVRVNGNIVTNLNLSILPAILSVVALEAALNAVDAEMYMWESPEMERQLQAFTKSVKMVLLR